MSELSLSTRLRTRRSTTINRRQTASTTTTPRRSTITSKHVQRKINDSDDDVEILEIRYSASKRHREQSETLTEPDSMDQESWNEITSLNRGTEASYPH